MSDLKITFLAVVLANFGSFLWSVIGVFRKADERKEGDYRALQLVSLAIWFLSTYVIVTSEISEEALYAGIAVEAVCLAVFWNQSRIVKKNGFSLAFSTDTPQVHVQHGLYKWVRHPFYSVYLCTYLTIAVVTLNPVLGALVLAMAVVYYRAARFEEMKFMGSPLAESYARYREQTGMFLPKVVGKRSAVGAERPDDRKKAA